MYFLRRVLSTFEVDDGIMGLWVFFFRPVLTFQVAMLAAIFVKLTALFFWAQIHKDKLPVIIFRKVMGVWIWVHKLFQVELWHVIRCNFDDTWR